MTRELQKLDEVSKAEHAEYTETETEFQSPQQDNSSQVDFSANVTVLHPSVWPLRIPN